jgi:hypothetical protein
MITKDQISDLRKRSTDRSVFTELMNSDPEFRAGVDRVRSKYPEISGFEEVKFHSSMLDIYTGVKRGNVMDKSSEILVHATKGARPGPFDQSLGSYAAETIGNVIPSTASLIGGVAKAVSHPIQTGKTLFQIGAGGLVNTLESIASIAGVHNPEDIFDLESEEVASAVGDFYVQRYGSIEAAATTLRDDPAGFLSDLGAVVAGVGGIVKGGAGALGSATGAATRSATQLSSLGRGIRAAQSVGTTAIRTGINIEPIVIAGRGVLLAGRGARSVLRASGPTAMTERLISSSLKLHPNQLANFEKFNGESAAKFMIRKGILSGGEEIIDAQRGVILEGSNPFGRTRIGMVDDLDRIAKTAKRTVDNLLDGVRQTYDLIDDAPDVLKALSELEDTAKTYGLIDDLEFVRGMIKKERLTLSDINSVKRRMDDLYNLYTVSNEPSASLIAERLRRIRRGIKEFIEVEAERKGIPDIGLLNEDTQKATALLKYSERAAMTGMGRNVISLMDLVTGSAAFGITRDPFSSIGIIVARRVLDSAPFKMTLAKFMNRLTKGQIDSILNAVKSGVHTKETRTLLRKVVSQTAEDLKNNKIAEQENRMANITIQNSPANKSAPEVVSQQKIESPSTGTVSDQTLPVNPESTVPKELPQ